MDSRVYVETTPILPFRAIVLPMDRGTVALRLSLLGVGLLAGCPQLLDDNFDSALFHGGPDVGERICTAPDCSLTSADASAPDLPPSDGGAPPPVRPTAPSDGDAGDPEPVNLPDASVEPGPGAAGAAGSPGA